MASRVSLRVGVCSHVHTKYSSVPGNELQAAAPKAPALPASSPARLDAGNSDGNYFVNCSNSNGSTSSGMAYYAKLNPGQNVGQPPTDYADVDKDTYVDWTQPGAGKNLFCHIICSYADLHSVIPKHKRHRALVRFRWLQKARCQHNCGHGN